MPSQVLPVPRKKPEVPDESVGKTTVKIRADIHLKARTVASHLDMELVDYLDMLLRTPVDRAYAKMARDIREGEKPSADEK